MKEKIDIKIIKNLKYWFLWIGFFVLIEILNLTIIDRYIPHWSSVGITIIIMSCTLYYCSVALNYIINIIKNNILSDKDELKSFIENSNKTLADNIEEKYSELLTKYNELLEIQKSDFNNISEKISDVNTSLTEKISSERCYITTEINNAQKVLYDLINKYIMNYDKNYKDLINWLKNYNKNINDTLNAKFENIAQVSKENKDSINNNIDSAKDGISKLLSDNSGNMAEGLKILLANLENNLNNIISCIDSSSTNLTSQLLNETEAINNRLISDADDIEEKYLSSFAAINEAVEVIKNKITDKINESSNSLAISVSASENKIINDIEEKYKNASDMAGSLCEEVKNHIDCIASDSKEKIIEQSNQNANDIKSEIKEAGSNSNDRIELLHKNTEENIKQTMALIDNNNTNMISSFEDMKVKVNSVILDNRTELNESAKHIQEDLKLLDKNISNNQKLVSDKLSEIEDNIKTGYNNTNQNIKYSSEEFNNKLNTISEDISKTLSDIIGKVQCNNTSIRETENRILAKLESLNKEAVNVRTSLFNSINNVKDKIKSADFDYTQKTLASAIKKADELKTDAERYYKAVRVDVNEAIEKAENNLTSAVNNSNDKTENKLKDLLDNKMQIVASEVKNLYLLIGLLKNPASNKTNSAKYSKNELSKVEKIEDKENNTSIVNHYENGILDFSEMYVKNKKTYYVKYGINNAIVKSISYNTRGDADTELSYYNSGQVKERKEYIIKNGKRETVIAKFDENGNKLK